MATLTRYDSWKSRLIAKVKECRDTIKNAIKSPCNSSIPDTITFSNIASKREEYMEEAILMRNSTVNADQGEKLDTSWSVGPTDPNYLLDSSVLASENEMKEEFLEEENAFPMKKKISAEPFLSYAEGTAKFIWPDDTMEDSFSSSKPSNSSEHLNFTDTDFGNPCTNSTFNENSHENNNRMSSPIKSYSFHDSGFENI
ncbi:uncharacterized protein LOC143427956 [Xylocopa sonorina]|uniref:uncharacterized protein LOC143427956 n=1 Tax=Xylocopa sonorina TaxID=1818115 RepID=UPI00403B0C7B